MNKKLLKKLQARHEKRLGELRSAIESGEIRDSDLQTVTDEIDGLVEELQTIKDELTTIDDEAEPAEETEPAAEETTEEDTRDAETGEPENRSGMIDHEQRDGLLGAIRTGLEAQGRMNREQRNNQIRSAFANFIVGNISESEARSLGIEAGNGSVTVPEIVASEVISYAQEENFLRRLGQVVTTPGNMKYPILVKKAKANGHKKERTKGNPIPETDIEFDEIYLEPTEFDALATVTKKLLKQTGLPVEQIVMDELKKAYVRKEVQYMVHGNETDNVNPGALSKKAVKYVPSAEDVELFDQLVSMKNSVPKVVRKKARWVLNTAAITKIEKMKTKDGFPLLKPLEQAQDGCDYKLLGFLVEEEEEISSEGKEDTPIFYFGDFYSFKIQDVTGSLELEVLRELFTETNRVGFKLYSLLDAQLIYSPFEPTIYQYELVESAAG